MPGDKAQSNAELSVLCALTYSQEAESQYIRSAGGRISCASLCAHKFRSSTQEPSYFTGSDVRIRDPDLPTLQFAVAWKGAAYSDPDSIPLMVMQQMLGAWNKASGVDDTTASRAPLSFLHHATD